MAQSSLNKKKEINADLIIHDAMILTMNPTHEVFADGAIAIINDRILEIGNTVDILEKYTANEIIDGSGKMIMPGLINTHTHVPMTIFRGYADDMPLHEWLYDYIFPVESEFVNSENVGLGTKLALAEMLRSGTTTFNDMYYHIEDIANVVDSVGMRAVLSESVIDFPAPNSPTPEDGLKTAEGLIKKWGNHPRITISVSAHALYSCSPELIQSAKALADKYNVPFNIHVAETRKEFDAILKDFGLTPVGYLDKLGVLGKNVIAAHGVHLTPEDISILAERGVSVAHNPECNMKLASGVAPVPELLKAGVKVGLGTDGVASNNDLDLFDEMNTAAILHKLNSNDPSVMDALTVVEMATMGGARVLGMENEIGSLEPGKKADILIIDMLQPHAHPIYNIYSLLVYSMKAADVESVIIDGKFVMRDRKILNLDEKALFARIENVAFRIREKNNLVSLQKPAKG
ncbi:MAG: amidohydrolase [Bacteroidetes bacterium]|nr:MAG: amidohydrolase [Bacteroidota bacterium]